MAPSSFKKARIPTHGVLLLDKPAGLSSNDALIKAKRLFNAQKAGHTGTLDPFATGLLPLCFGEATKFSQDLLEADKSYEAVIRLGIRTDTGDTEGETLETCPVDASRDQIENALHHFRGEIDQVPPMYSALKRNGKPLYEYARAGIVLQREARRITIHAFDLIDYQPPFLTVHVTCSKGTYIRVLGEDLGTKLGCGAHLQALRRLRVGPLTLDSALTLEALVGLADEAERATLLAPVDALLSSLAAVQLPDGLATRFLHGQRIALDKEGIPLPATPGRVRVYRAEHGLLLGTAQLSNTGVLAPERLISTVSG
ncbi:MAG TPA: tRNA pseudouridine(55) synthase TruB [Burkholderiaceae bacterium]|jgi:tRNA pseudouridine55 synthase|nr:tRNA pseudouridine(55) synthase TruB [Burkholderiaceae bacterium]